MAVSASQAVFTGVFGQDEYYREMDGGARQGDRTSAESFDDDVTSVAHNEGAAAHCAGLRWASLGVRCNARDPPLKNRNNMVPTFSSSSRHGMG